MRRALLTPHNQSRVTLSPRYERLGAVRGPRQEEKAPEIRRKRDFFPQAKYIDPTFPEAVCPLALGKWLPAVPSADKSR